MRPLLIVEALKIAEPAKLLAQAARRWVGGIAQQGQMQPLEPTVLLRFAGGDALRPDPRLDDLDRQPRQSAGAGRRKWRPVVRAQPQRQTKFQKRDIEHRPDVLAVSPPQRLAAQQVPAVGVAQGQRLAMRAVAGQKPALEIDAPYRIGIAARGKWGARWRTAPAPLAFDRQSFAVEQLPDRARRRPWRRGIVPLEPGPHLDRPPAAMRLAHRQAALGDRRTHRLRVRMRRPRPFAEPREPIQPIALQPFVAGLAREPETTAQRRHRLFTRFRRRHKAHPLIHRTGPQSSHRRVPPRRRVHPLPMSPVYNVTHLPGQDPLPSLPNQGGGLHFTTRIRSAEESCHSAFACCPGPARSDRSVRSKALTRHGWSKSDIHDRLHVTSLEYRYGLDIEA